MSFRRMVAEVINHTFTKACGKNQLSKPEHERRALHITFSARIDYEKEEGYRYIELVIYGPANYVQVWTRDRWTVIPVEDLEDEDDGGPKPGKGYIEGSSAWEMVGFHDSGWRSSVENLLSKRERDIDGFTGSDWYKLVDPKTLGLEGE